MQMNGPKFDAHVKVFDEKGKEIINQIVPVRVVARYDFEYPFYDCYLRLNYTVPMETDEDEKEN